MLHVLLLIAITCTFSMPGIAMQGDKPATHHVDQAMSAVLLKGHVPQRVEWYHDGPFPPASPNNPQEYLPGVVVYRSNTDKSVLARWQGQLTTIPSFYRQLNGLWRTKDGKTLISVSVQYGGRVLYLYMLQLRRNKLLQSGYWGGADLAIMRLKGRLVVEVVPSSYSQVPALYQWNGVEFNQASHEFPLFYARLGHLYNSGIYSTHSVPTEAVVTNCLLAFSAWALAGSPAVGVRACRAAKQRIASGRGIVPGSSRETAQEFTAERKHAIEQIDVLLTGRHIRP